ncbi:MAG: hypothetical protein GY861_03265 [bacterium]|nr:hypothetical protein [bacterium]
MKIKTSDFQVAKTVPMEDAGDYYTGTKVEDALQIIGKSRADSYHYTGFPNRDDTSLSWDDGTYTLTLTASDDKIWMNGIEYEIDTLTKQLTSGGGSSQEETTGLYWFWITAPGGVPQLNTSTTSPDIGAGGANAGFDQCLVATVYWNTSTSKGLLSDERHWFGRDAWMHEYLHETVGARFYEGMAGTFTNTTFEIGAGEFYDEDIEHENDAETVATVLYHDGDNDWAWDVATSTPYKTDGTDLQYNNGTALASANNNRYVNYFFFMTPDTTDPVHIVIGDDQYTTKAAAIDAPIPSLGALPSAENLLIYKVTYKNNSGGTHAHQNTTDFRTSSTSPSTGYVPTDHGSLAGLSDDDHPQYVLHSLADAENDFLIASGADTFVKKTLAETGAILEGDIAHDNIVSGTIAAHDTGATGAELDTLTDSSDADALHTHTGGNLTDDIFVLTAGDDMTGPLTITVSSASASSILDLDQTYTGGATGAANMVDMTLTHSGTGNPTVHNLFNLNYTRDVGSGSSGTVRIFNLDTTINEDLGAFVGFNVGGTIGAGKNVTAFTHFAIDALAGSGTVTDMVGLDIGRIDEGSNSNCAIRTATVGGNICIRDYAEIVGSRDNIQLRVQAHSSQTTLFSVWEDSAGNDQITFSGTGGAVFNEEGNDADFRVEGDANTHLIFADASADFVGIGTSSPWGLLSSIYEKTNPTGFTVALIGTTAALVTGSNNANPVYGSWFQATTDASSTHNLTLATGGLIGIDGKTQNMGDADVTMAIGCNFQVRNRGDGDITTAIGFRVNTPTNDGAGKIDNEYGVKIEDHNVGDTASWSLYTGAGIVSFGDAYGGRELSADPDNPAEGSHVIWQSDGTGSGDDGDILMKITAGGSTKTVTLVNFSAL